MTGLLKRRINKKRMLTVLCIVLLLYIVVLFLQQESTFASLRLKEEELKTQISQTKAEGEAYRKVLQETGSDKYIEQEARDKLGMIKEGELQFKNKTD
jgi:cell division protein FtsB